MKLVKEFDELFSQFAPCFAQDRSYQRARTMAFGQLVTFGRRTISRIICSQDEQDDDWSANYKLYSRNKWQPHSVFSEILKESDHYSNWNKNAIVTAMDDTAIHKTGKKIEPVRTLRDPMSLPYHVNLIKAIRYIQVSVITNPDENLALARAIPIRFEEAAPAQKPPKNASDDVKESYKRSIKINNLSNRGRDIILDVRKQVDELPDGKNRALFVCVDGSYCNRNFLRNLPDNIIPIARTRKDIAIFLPAEKNPMGRRKIYGERLPKPEQIRKDESYPWQTAKVFGAGKFHNVKYKTVAPILWQKGTAQIPMRLIIVAPLRYRKKKNSKLLYRQTAYLLCPYVDVPIEQLLQYYFFRWDIEVNNRDEKSLLGVGDAQVRSEESVAKNPQLAVIAASTLVLASLRAYGPTRTDDYFDLPKWRKEKIRRPSMLDLVSQFRYEIMKEQLQMDADIKKSAKKKNTKKAKKPRSRIEARKRGVVNNFQLQTTRLKLPVNILNALIYANC
jgi:hypothetical protein